MTLEEKVDLLLYLHQDNLEIDVISKLIVYIKHNLNSIKNIYKLFTDNKFINIEDLQICGTKCFTLNECGEFDIDYYINDNFTTSTMYISKDSYYYNYLLDLYNTIISE